LQTNERESITLVPRNEFLDSAYWYILLHGEYHWCLLLLIRILGVQGNSKFVYDVDTVHNLHVTFRVRGFVTSNAIIMQAAQAISESSRRSDKEGRIRAVEPVNFFPEIMSGGFLISQFCLLTNLFGI